MLINSKYWIIYQKKANLPLKLVNGFIMKINSIVLLAIKLMIRYDNNHIRNTLPFTNTNNEIRKEVFLLIQNLYH
jgi:hypothetical protein